MLAILFIIIGKGGNDHELYYVAIFLFVLKSIIIPRYLMRLHSRIRSRREVEPYVNVATSLIIAGLLVLLAYAVTRPLVAVSTLPTRGGLPLAVGLIFVGLFVIITRKKALTQVVGFLVMENGVAMLAVLGTYGIPLIIELGVFLDVLMGYLVMQIFIYQIKTTFDTIDVDRLNQLKHS